MFKRIKENDFDHSVMSMVEADERQEIVSCFNNLSTEEFFELEARDIEIRCFPF